MRSAIEKDESFGKAAVEKDLVPMENLARAALIQKHVFSRTRVNPPISKVLYEMGALNAEQVQLICGELQLSRLRETEPAGAVSADSLVPFSTAFNLFIFENKLKAILFPTGLDHRMVTALEIKQLLTQNGVSYGLISDDKLTHYLGRAQLPDGYLQVAQGTPPEAGCPPEVKLYFENDSMRIGTLKEDGTMDWKNRGGIPQVEVDQILAEKVGGDPGDPGIDIFGMEIPPPKVKEPVLKSGKGAVRSEDGRRIVARINGMPKLDAMGRIGVLSVFSIEGDIGPETGHVEFSGFVDVGGAVTDGYKVKAEDLAAMEIQCTEIEVGQDIAVRKGIYNATLNVGGDLRASHIHNTKVVAGGNLIVEKEIVNCTIETRGKVSVLGGRILSSRIFAKKGVYAKDIGSAVTRSSELTVGVDLQHDREIGRFQNSLKALEAEKSSIEKNIVNQKKKIDELDAQLGRLAQEQDKVMVLNRQLQEQYDRNGDNAVTAELEMLSTRIQKLSNKFDQYDAAVNTLMEQGDQARTVLAGLAQQLKSVTEEVRELAFEMNEYEESAKQDQAVPVVKVSGTIYAKTRIGGASKRLILAEDLQRVKIHELRNDFQQTVIEVSSF